MIKTDINFDRIAVMRGLIEVIIQAYKEHIIDIALTHHHIIMYLSEIESLLKGKI